MPPRQLKIVSWNARGLCGPRAAELKSLALESKANIILVQETLLKSTNKCYIPGFRCFRGDRTGPGGGLATFIKLNIKSALVSHHQDENIEVLNVKVSARPTRNGLNDDGDGSLLISNVYIPKDSKHIRAKFKKLLVRDKCIIGGDLNAKHPDWSVGINNWGRKLADLLPYNNYSLHVSDSPTYHGASGVCSTLDLFISNVIGLSPVELVGDYMSDHRPITTSTALSWTPQPPRQKFDSNNASWVMFQTHVRDNLNFWDPAITGNLDDALDNCAVALLAAVTLRFRSKP